MKTYTATYASSLGPIVIESDGEAITSLRFCDEPENTVSTAQGVEVLKEAFPREAATTPPIIAETLRWLEDYFAGKRPCNVPRLNPQGTAFQKRVWQTLLTIPYGKTISYGEIAKMVECRSAQAVGQAVGANPIALIIPCHRVIAANGQLGGYAYGTEIKKRLLEQEQQ
jgi:methylated-DNA-[protein]-cysteine S-methyltransferase